MTCLTFSEYAPPKKLLYRNLGPVNTSLIAALLPPHRRDPHRKPVDTRIAFRPVIVKRVVSVLQFGRAAPFLICLGFQLSDTHDAHILTVFALGDVQSPAIPLSL